MAISEREEGKKTEQALSLLSLEKTHFFPSKNSNVSAALLLYQIKLIIFRCSCYCQLSIHNLSYSLKFSTRAGSYVLTFQKRGGLGFLSRGHVILANNVLIHLQEKTLKQRWKMISQSSKVISALLNRTCCFLVFWF